MHGLHLTAHWEVRLCESCCIGGEGGSVMYFAWYICSTSNLSSQLNCLALNDTFASYAHATNGTLYYTHFVSERRATEEFRMRLSSFIAVEWKGSIAFLGLEH